MKENENYANETFPDFNSVEEKLESIVHKIKNDTYFETKKITSKKEILKLFNEKFSKPNNSENKDYRGLYVFAEKNDNGCFKYLYTGITRSAIQRLNDHINAPDKGSATWAYLMVKNDTNTNAELKNLIKKYHHKKKTPQIKKKLREQISEAIKNKQKCISKLYVTFIPIENDNYFLSVLEPYVAAKLKCKWNSFKTH